MSNKNPVTESKNMVNKKLLLSTLILVWLILPLSMCLGATDYYIDRTNGNDANPGTIDEPFATLEGARTAIRNLKTSTGLPEGGVTVCLRGGIYERTATFELDSEDSGEVDKPIVYRAYPGEEVMISGGKSIVSPWEEYNENIYLTNVEDLSFNSLFVNGRRATRAREPDPTGEGYYYLIKSVDPETNLIAFRFAEGDIDPNWHNLRDVEVVSYRKWEQSRRRIDRIEADKVYFQRILEEGKGYDWTYYGKPGRYYVENVFEGLDSPGEWYLDKNTGDLYYWPLPGEDIHNSEIIAPVIEEIIKVQQASYITFKNLTFSHTDWQLPEPEEVYHTKFSFTVGFHWAENCTVEDCVIKHSGATYAVGCLWGVTNNNINIIGNEIYDIGGGGIALCSGETEDAESCIISDNIIHDIGKVDKWVMGMYFFGGYDFTVSHNLIYNAPYGGIGFLTRNYQDGHPWKKNIIEYNEIYNVMQELNDGGAIHVAGHQPETLIQYNKIHDVVVTDMHQTKVYFHGIYLHDGAKGFIVKNNVVYRTDNGLLLYVSPNNIITNNIFANSVSWDLVFSGYAEPEFSRDRYQPGNTFTRNIIYTTGKSKLLLVIEPLSVLLSDYNLFYTTDPGNPKWNLEWWKTTYGFDQNSIEAEPLFEDYANDDFRLKTESPVFSLGFEQIDLTDAGPRRRPKTFYGDVSGNGKITAYDAFLAAQYAAGLIHLTPEQILAADVDGDEGVSIDDADLIDRYVEGSIDRFPADNGPLS